MLEEASLSENHSKNPARNRISLELLARRCLAARCQDISPEKIAENLNAVTHVRLDRENLKNIDGLELIGDRAMFLYLQHNEISRIENLETLVNLRFITLSHNRIQKIQNLLHLNKLGFLDISHNEICVLDIDQLPKSLVILNLEGNACQQLLSKEQLIESLPSLRQLDGEELSYRDRRSAGHEVTSETESDDDETLPNQASQLPFHVEISGVFDDLSTDLFLRCQTRIQRVFDEHKQRLMSLEDIKKHSGFPMDGLEYIRSQSVQPSLVEDSPDSSDSSRPVTAATIHSTGNIDGSPDRVGTGQDSAAGIRIAPLADLSSCVLKTHNSTRCDSTYFVDDEHKLRETSRDNDSYFTSNGVIDQHFVSSSKAENRTVSDRKKTTKSVNTKPLSPAKPLSPSRAVNRPTGKKQQLRTVL